MSAASIRWPFADRLKEKFKRDAPPEYSGSEVNLGQSTTAALLSEEDQMQWAMRQSLISSPTSPQQVQPPDGARAQSSGTWVESRPVVEGRSLPCIGDPNPKGSKASPVTVGSMKTVVGVPLQEGDQFMALRKELQESKNEAALLRSRLQATEDDLQDSKLRCKALQESLQLAQALRLGGGPTPGSPQQANAGLVDELLARISDLEMKLATASPHPQEGHRLGIHAWLETIKPGFGGRFAPSFLNLGYEDMEDLAAIPRKVVVRDVTQLLAHLRIAGAKGPQERLLTEAIQNIAGSAEENARVMQSLQSTPTQPALALPAPEPVTAQPSFCSPAQSGVADQTSGHTPSSANAVSSACAAASPAEAYDEEVLRLSSAAAAAASAEARETETALQAAAAAPVLEQKTDGVPALMTAAASSTPKGATPDEATSSTSAATATAAAAATPYSDELEKEIPRTETAMLQEQESVQAKHPTSAADAAGLTCDAATASSSASVSAPSHECEVTQMLQAEAQSADAHQDVPTLQEEAAVPQAVAAGQAVAQGRVLPCKSPTGRVAMPA